MTSYQYGNILIVYKLEWSEIMKSLLILSALFVFLSFNVFAQAASLSIAAQPAATTIKFAGFISGDLTVRANGTGTSYQWFSNTVNSNAGGTAIAGATGASFPIPTNLPPGEHFFFSEVRVPGGTTVRSNVAIVRVFDFEECDLC